VDRLVSAGAVVNSLIVVATGKALAQAFSLTVPLLVREFVNWRDYARGEPGTLAALYEGLPENDLTRDVLQRRVESLSVLHVPPCGWTDIGTPERLHRYLHLAAGQQASA
jgi:hypothetical protein